MTRTRTLLFACVICGLSIGGFLAGRVSAQQVARGEEVSNYEFPLAWGAFKTALPQETGYVCFFEASDGTIRTVHISYGNPKGGTYLGRVYVTPRGPGIVR